MPATQSLRALRGNPAMPRLRHNRSIDTAPTALALDCRVASLLAMTKIGR